jgi:hypothetical protein
MVRNRTIQVLINGHLTDAIDVESSVPQGDSMSPLLFDLGIEPVIARIRDDPECEGISIAPGQEIKGEVFADDSCTVAKNEASFKKQISHFVEWGQASGVTLNHGKCVFIANQPKGDLAPGWKVLQGTAQEKYLGWPRTVRGFTNSAKERVAILQKDLKSWQSLRLSLTARVTVVNTYVYSKLWYTSPVDRYLKKQLQRIEALTKNFIAYKGPDETPAPLVRQERLIQPRHLGGLGLASVFFFFFF